MKTFYKYLFSYISILLLPSLILIFVISHIVSYNCTEFLLDKAEASLQQLSLSIDMQTELVDSYAVQIIDQSDFYARNQEKIGNMYSIRRTLKQWTMGNAFMEDISYYNTKINRVYSFNALYSVDGYAKWRLSAYNDDADRIAAVLQTPSKQRWVSLSNGTILYICSTRITQNETGIILARLNIDALMEMLNTALPYSDVGFEILDAQDQLLYTVSQQEYSDSLNVEFESSEGLKYIANIPREDLEAPLHSIWLWMYMGIIIVFVLGTIVIWYGMRMNYKPIRKLEQDALTNSKEHFDTGDSIENVRFALEDMHRRHALIERNSRALFVERSILKLLMGDYENAEEFNRDAGRAGIQLHSDILHLLYIKGYDDENSVSDIAEIVRQTLSADAFYVELPENMSVVFILPGVALPEEKEALSQSLEERAIYVQFSIGETCNDLRKLSDLWHKQRQQFNTDFEQNGIQNLLDSLSSAIGSDEPERIPFVLETVRSEIPSLIESEELRSFIQGIFDICENQEDINSAAVSYLHRLRKQYQDQSDIDLEKNIPSLLEKLQSFLIETVCNPSSAQYDLTEKICSYLSEHSTDCMLTSSMVAEYFGMSVSNLGHYFKNHVGMPISSYLEQIRIDHAQKLLASTNENIAVIAQTVGYSTPATFMRSFKKITGLTPTAYRKGEGMSKEYHE